MLAVLVHSVQNLIVLYADVEANPTLSIYLWLVVNYMFYIFMTHNKRQMPYLYGC